MKYDLEYYYAYQQRLTTIGKDLAVLLIIGIA